MDNIRLEGGNYYHIYNRGNNRMNLFEEPADYERFLWLYDRYISPVAETLAWVLMPNHLHLLVRIKENVVYKYSKDRPIKINADRFKNAVGLTRDVEWDKFFEENKWETTDLSASEGPARLCHSGGPDNIGIPGESSSEVTGKTESVSNLNADRSATLSGLPKKPEPHKHFSHLFNAYTRYFHIRCGRTGNLFERPFKRILIDNDEYLRNVILYIHNNSVHHGFCSHPLEYPWSSYLSCVSEKPTRLKREFVLKLFGNKADFKTCHIENLSNPDLSAFEEPDNVGKRIN